MSKPIRRIRLLLVDDHPVVREGIRSCLAGHARLKIVGEAADGEEAIRLAKSLEPHVILMDINMPGMNGLEATEVIRREVSTVHVLALTVHKNREYVKRILHAGARGYILKDAPPAELVRAIEAVADGNAYFSPEAARHLLDEPGRPTGTTPSAADPPLSRREKQVLANIAEGLTNKEIASDLGISVRTVETHRERLMRKLSIYTAAGLTRYAIANGVTKI